MFGFAERKIFTFCCENGWMLSFPIAFNRTGLKFNTENSYGDVTVKVFDMIATE